MMINAGMMMMRIVLVVTVVATASTAAAVAAAAVKPNIVFILTDDQDIRLDGRSTTYTSIGSLASMPVTRQRLIQRGASADNMFVNTPICCPSRTEFFSGRYFHSVKAGKGTSNCMHADTSYVSRNDTGLFGLLRGAGYNVGVFGKVTNDQGSILKEAVAQSSVDFVDSPLDYNNFEGLTYFRYDGSKTFVETLDAKNPEFNTTYQTPQIGNRTLRWLEKAVEEKRPFFAYIGPHAPHFPATPAPWYRNAFDCMSAPMTPNYNVSSPGKAQHVRQNPPLDQRVRCWEDQHFRDRWASLLSVDDLVDDLFQFLERHGVADNTYVLFSSDHGYKQGQWRIGTSKQHPYETDIRVPLLVTGPGIEPGTTFPQIAGNVDILPTILELANCAQCIPTDVEGKSVASFLKGKERPEDKSWRHSFLNEYLSVGTYYNDHSNAWAPEGYADKCGGNMPKAPEAAGTSPNCTEAQGTGEGECYFVDSTHSNSWRQLRVINTTHDWNYVEYDPEWAFAGTPQHFELYDIARDPYQVENIYAVQSNATKEALAKELAAYWQCRGKECP